jgi:hypothetical protein
MPEMSYDGKELRFGRVSAMESRDVAKERDITVRHSSAAHGQPRA